jgi:phospholipid-binding lipoprotein MlaA
MTRPPSALHLFAVAALIGLLGACATPPPASDPEALAEYYATNDPAEPFNRAMYDVHQAIDGAILRPINAAYRVLPPPVRNSVSSILSNIRTPVVLINDMLQGQSERAGETLGRFVINTTIGLGGIFDVADRYFGVPVHYEDFGQTLATFGVGEGPFLFIPILGPSNMRDLVGLGLDTAAQPLNWFGQGLAVDILAGVRGGAVVLDNRDYYFDVIDDMNRTSLDPYATVRTARRQARETAIANRDAVGHQPPSR